VKKPVSKEGSGKEGSGNNEGMYWAAKEVSARIAKAGLFVAICGTWTPKTPRMGFRIFEGTAQQSYHTPGHIGHARSYDELLAWLDGYEVHVAIASGRTEELRAA